MTSTQDVKTFVDIFDASWIEICRIVRDRLEGAGITIGAIVKDCTLHGHGNTYRITRIDTNVHYSAYIALYGNQLRKDNTFGDAIHYIGRPYEVEVLK